MFNIITILIISQPSIPYYEINDFSNPTIASSNIEYACWNPAAINDIESLSFAGSVAYTNGNFDISSIFDEDLHYKTSEFLPEFLGIVFPLNEKISLGFSFSIPYKYSDTSSWFPIQYPPTEDSVKLGSALRFYAFNPIVSYKIKENLTIGINPGILVKKNNEYAEYNSPDSSKREWNGTYFGAEPNLGVQYQLNETSRIDLSIKKGFLQGTETWPGEEYSVKEILPLIVSLGTQINMSPQFTINNAVEFIHRQGINFYVDGEKVELGKIRNVFRIHLGGEYKIKSKYALRLGIYSNPNHIEKIFLIGGIGAEFGRLKINLAASSSRFSPTGFAFNEKETNNFHLSIVY